MKKIIAVILGVLVFCGVYVACRKTYKTHNTISAQYENVINEAAPQVPAEADIYIDASGSMKPYFGDDEIINAVSKIEGLMTNQTKVYFLANPPKLYKGMVNVILEQVSKQPSLCATTFHDFFKQQGARVDTTNTIVYLVTDGIMSIGPGNTKTALIGLENRIKASLEGYNNLAAAILRYSGNYDGQYYNQNNTPVRINQERPFYIIALGQKQYIEWLQDQKAEDLYNPQGKLFLGLHDFEGHAKPTVMKSIADNKIDPYKEVELTLDLPMCLKDLPESFLQQAKITNNGQSLNMALTRQGNSIYLKIPPLSPGFSSDAAGNYHTQVIIPNAIPTEWQNWNADTDIQGPDDSTTFGLIYLINGMFKALEPYDNLLEVSFDYSH